MGGDPPLPSSRRCLAPPWLGEHVLGPSHDEAEGRDVRWGLGGPMKGATRCEQGPLLLGENTRWEDSKQLRSGNGQSRPQQPHRSTAPSTAN